MDMLCRCARQGGNRGMKMSHTDNTVADRLQASPSDRATVGKLAARLRELPPARMELIRRVRREIAAGTYETPQRLEKTAEKLAEELFQDYIGH